ncbi:MAG: hypothetical protein ACRDD7_17310 [Peptostreptococcaceae bacterium]
MRKDILEICNYAYKEMKDKKHNEAIITMNKRQLEFVICSLEGQYAFEEKLDEFLGLKGVK